MTEQEQKDAPEQSQSRPKLPFAFGAELQKAYVKQQKRKIRATPVPSVNIRPEDLASFSEHLKSSKKIMALLGAGLSAPSGIPTFQGASAFWRDQECAHLATPGAFGQDPSLSWQFYNDRRNKALYAKPNRGHFALAELARKKPNFLAINQNIDGLCQRANHPAENLQPVHGSLFDIKCGSKKCTYIRKDDTTNPIVPALALTEGEDISDPNIPLKDIPIDDLPRCPECSTLLRPGIVWFGEPLEQSALDRIDEWMHAGGEKIDLMLVIGTRASVYPAAGYIHAARAGGARIAIFNLEGPGEDEPGAKLREQDWFFQGDASEVLPEVLTEVIGPIAELQEDSISRDLESLKIDG